MPPFYGGRVGGGGDFVVVVVVAFVTFFVFCLFVCFMPASSTKLSGDSTGEHG